MPPEYGFEKIECYMQGVRDYIKYIKRGYTRPSHLSAIDLRHDKITHEQALKNIDEYEGKRPPSLDIFLEYLGLSEDEFYEIASSHKISPHNLIDPRSSQEKKLMILTNGKGILVCQGKKPKFN